MDLYACGSLVHVPSLGIKSTNKQLPIFTSSAVTKLSLHSEEAVDTLGNSQQDKTTAPRRLARRQIISELGHNLKFENKVVSTHCPEAITYKDAKKKFNGLYYSKTTHQNRTKKINVGRCNMRGDGRRHMPCHLSQSSTVNKLPSLTNTVTQPQTKPVKTTRSTSMPINLPQTSKSFAVKWEETALEGVSLPTAKTLVGRSHGDEREHLEVMLRKREERLKPLESSYQVSDITIPVEERDKPAGKIEPTVYRKDYLTELAEGAIPLYQSQVNGPTDVIVLSNNTTFNKVLQPIYPKGPGSFIGHETSNQDMETVETVKCVKGQRKWLSLPVRAPTPTEIQWVIQTNISNSSGEIQKEEFQEDYKVTKTEELLKVAQELLGKWHVHVQHQDISPERALQDLTAVSVNVQLYGLGIATNIIQNNVMMNHLKHTSSCDLISIRSKEERGPNLPEDVVQKVSDLLLAEVERVRVISAVLLCCLGERNEEIFRILHCSTENGDSTEQWAAIQCLALEGICTAVIVKGLLSNLSSSITSTLKCGPKQERAAILLARLSQESRLVYAMLLEQLNSKSSQDRYTACKLLPQLHGGINRDVCNRLVTMSWDDWSPDVRMAAAQALGTTGHAKLVHDELERRLKEKNESTRLDALRKLHILHLMTTKLLPAFVECFKDDRISVKLETIAVAEALSLNDDDVIAALTNLMHDSCWKVKAHAIRALGLLRAKDILSHLLWAVRFERLPEVRAESCNALALLGIRNDKVASALKDILIVEDNSLVLNQAKEALLQLGYEPMAEDSMAETVCAEVKRLGSQNAITEQILASQDKQMVDYMLTRPMCSLSSRDYLNERLRHKYIINKATHPNQSPDKNGIVWPSVRQDTELTENRPWSPDKEGINGHLENIRRQCQLDTTNFTTVSS